MTVPDHELFRWLEEFTCRRGRPLRVLHIGNIANNAYNNACIQRSYGIAADVVSYDSRHVTATPEWEDADVAGDVDPDLPDWWAVDLGDWRRPRWFVDGPLLACLSYLRCRHAGHEEKAHRVRTSLILDYWKMLADDAVRRGGQRAGGPLAGSALTTSRALGHVPSGATGGPPPREALAAWLAAAASEDALRRHRARLLTDVLAPALRRARGPRHASAPSPRALWQAMRSALAGSGGMLLFALTRPLTSSAAPAAKANAVRERADRLRALHRAHLPEARARDVEDDVAWARGLAGPWADVLGHYDVVQGYATDGVIPLFHGVASFTAYEHGTIRSIPFEDDTRGRLCNLTYRCAPRIFVTNTDVLPSVARLGIRAGRVVRLPHAIDDRKLRAFRDAHAHLEPPVGPPVFVSPTRHHWARGTDSWLKGNDVFLRAAGRLAAAGRAFSVVLVAWGAEVDDSKALIDELGLSDRVRWVPMMSKRRLWAAYCRAHAVVDQFAIPALGGVGIEALALGRRLITRVDEPTLADFFGACPPVLNAATVAEVERAMRGVLDDPADHRGLGTAGRVWIETYHSAARIMALQLGAYRDLVGTAAD
jgi:hypothetical protein